MNLTLNFAPESFEGESLSVAGLLERKRWTFPLIIVKVNGELVPRESYALRPLAEGDVVEAYHLVSGG